MTRRRALPAAGRAALALALALALVAAIRASPQHDDAPAVCVMVPARVMVATRPLAEVLSVALVPPLQAASPRCVLACPQCAGALLMATSGMHCGMCLWTCRSRHWVDVDGCSNSPCWLPRLHPRRRPRPHQVREHTLTGGDLFAGVVYILGLQRAALQAPRWLPSSMLCSPCWAIARRATHHPRASPLQ